ncbi:MAG TPA: hypothetical protein VGA37_08375 [Gemmatimonadales bacterium]
MKRMTSFAFAIVLIASAACATGIRPAYSPLVNARVDTVNAEPPAIIQELATLIAAEAMYLQWQSPVEGFLETQWFNLVTRESGVTSRSDPDRVILLRFWADPIGEGRSAVISEAVIKRTTDPSVLPRDQEMMAPPGHGGQRTLDRVLNGLRERFGR